MAEEHGGRARPRHDEERMHGVTGAEGPGSPGGMSKAGRAQALHGRDPGTSPAEQREGAGGEAGAGAGQAPRGQAPEGQAPENEPPERDAHGREASEGEVHEGVPGDRGYREGAEVRPPQAQPGHGVAEAMGEGRFGEADRPRLGQAEDRERGGRQVAPREGPRR